MTCMQKQVKTTTFTLLYVVLDSKNVFHVQTVMNMLGIVFEKALMMH